MDNRTEEIRAMKAKGMTLRAIGDVYGITRERVRQIIGISPEEAKKVRARARVQQAAKRGDITKLPCSVCGDESVEAHHTDYDKPLEVIWFCKKHHEEHHHNNRSPSEYHAMTQAEKNSGRYQDEVAAAKRDGFKGRSAALTAWQKGEAVMVWVKREK